MLFICSWYEYLKIVQWCRLQRWSRCIRHCFPKFVSCSIFSTCSNPTRYRTNMAYRSFNRLRHRRSIRRLRSLIQPCTRLGNTHNIPDRREQMISLDISLDSIAESTAQSQRYDREPRGLGIILHRAPSHTLPPSIVHNANVHSPFDQRSLPA